MQYWPERGRELKPTKVLTEQLKKLVRMQHLCILLKNM